ncbi:ML domain-containing protein [Streptomyces buecherae]|uniref:Uncharacterized protein n=1 Tax=Streptomyces buecherae TaxID=2763006 RepID=A0A7H8NEH6_9ACTN|nr:ML domain-containing protein [Streptomyces buecherae]QKW52880.1 hypothetical protein HUT08_28805 [Streptomyces buecherae]
MRNSLAHRARSVVTRRPRRTLGAAIGAGAVLFGVLAVPSAGAADEKSSPETASSVRFPASPRAGHAAPASDEISKVRVTRNEVPVKPGSKTKVTVTVDSPEAGHIWVYLDRVHVGDMGKQWANGPHPGLTAKPDKKCVFFTDPEKIGIGTGFKCPTPKGHSKVVFTAKVPKNLPSGSVAFFDAYHQIGSSMWNAGSFSGGFGVK